MKNLNICIDIDGTITDPYYWLNYANEYFNLNYTEDQITTYNIAEALNISSYDYDIFYEKNKFLIHRTENLRDDVKDILDILYKYNNIFFVTARDKSLELLTNQYLKNNHIPYDGVFVLGSCNKVPTAQNLNCDIFIEDSYDNAIQLSANNFKVLLVDTNYNRLPLNDNIIRVYNWKQIFEFISELSGEYLVLCKKQN